MKNAASNRLAKTLFTLFLVFAFKTVVSALPILGLTDNNRLLFFDSARPDTIIKTSLITGMQPGENALGIDLRPQTGQLYAVGSTSRLYRIDLMTGAATQVGSGPFSPALNVSPPNGVEIGFDFDPVEDRLRIVSNGQNLRLDPNTGTVVAVDGPLFNAAGDTEPGSIPNVTGVAYDNNSRLNSSTRLYGVDWRLDRLVRIDPATGETTTVGRLTGISPFFMEIAAFDIVPGISSRLAIASLTGADSFSSRLYAIDLGSGRAFEIGSVGGRGSNLFLRGLAALPPETNIHAVTTTNKLLLFNALMPDAIIRSRQITELEPGENVLAIDTRPADGRLYAITSASRFVELDPETARVLSVTHAPLIEPNLSGSEFGMSVHPLQDRVRIVSDADQNLSLGFGGQTIAIDDDPLAYKSGDPNAGSNPKVVAIAHAPNPAPDSLFSFFTYGIDSDRDVLVTMNVPNTGELTTVGSLNMATANDLVGFDIDRFSGAAYAALSPICFQGCPRPSLLTTIDLEFGSATSVGFIGTDEPVRAIALAHAATVQFSRPEFVIVEACTVARLVVTRTANADIPVAVEYATANGAAGAPPADSRSDYTAAFGTLRFAAGEAVKTIDILISEDSYPEATSLANFFEAFTVRLSKPTIGFGLGASSSATVLIVDDGDTAETANAIDDTTTFVCQHYHDFLNREPDPGGLAFWVNNIESCGTSPGCREVKRIDTSAAFFLSIESQETGFFVHRLNQAAFARSGVPLQLEEFLRDGRKVGEGVIIGQPGAHERLEANKRAFVDEFVARDIFRVLYPPDIIMTNAEFVDRLNTNSGGSLSQSERDTLVADLNAGRETRAGALRRLAEDSDFKQREFNRAFVLMQYFGYLRRDPFESPDGDLSGFNFWLSKLDSFGGDFRRAQMVKAFITATEYRRRFGQP